MAAASRRDRESREFCTLEAVVVSKGGALQSCYVKRRISARSFATTSLDVIRTSFRSTEDGAADARTPLFSCLRALQGATTSRIATISDFQDARGVSSMFRPV